MLSKLEIKKLRRELPTRYADVIAKKFDVSSSYIYAIVAGRRFNADIVNALIEYAKEHKEKNIKNREKLNSL